jgi:hypothetical protein
MYPFKTLVVSREGSGIRIILDSSVCIVIIISMNSAITVVLFDRCEKTALSDKKHKHSLNESL